MKGMWPVSILVIISMAASQCDGQNPSADVVVVQSNRRKVIIWVLIWAAVLGAIILLVAILLAMYRRMIRSALKTTLPLYRKSCPGDETALSKLVTASQHLDAINFGPRRFSYEELRVATTDFSEAQLLGRGGFGSVYKGAIGGEIKTTVAIKRMAKNSAQGEREFHAEVLSIGLLRHRNLVSLLGWCHERDELLLVYEFMAKGSLDQHLYRKQGYPTLPWRARFHILQEIASALDYLHNGWEKCILHRDIKPCNVLLDAHMTVRLGDFGLARLAGHTLASELQSGTRSNVGGTLGYMAPEVFMHGKLTKKADVYSFGMVALEVVCGVRPPGFFSEGDEECLVEFVWSAYQRGRLLEVLDPALHTTALHAEVQQQVTAALQLGLLCTLLDPALRPPTNRLLQALTGDFAISLPPSRLGSPSLASKGNIVYNNFTYAELCAATEDFSDARAVGRVYRGVTPSNEEVAVKRVMLSSQFDAFHGETLNMIARSRHRNVVSLLGWCYENKELFLVYEFMKKGSLDRHLQPRHLANALPWTVRFKILEGVAAALDYLHSGCQEKSESLHLAVTPQSVMLDAHMNVKLAYFGLHGITQHSRDPKDPYSAPELRLDNAAASVKSDVYSFGMLALEVVCRRSPRVEGEEDLVPLVRRMHRRGTLWDAIDPALHTAFYEQNADPGSGAMAFRNQVDFDFDEVKHRQQMTRVVQLGMSCTLLEPSLRPHSKRLIQALYGDWSIMLPPAYYYPDQASLMSSSSCSSSFDHSSVTDPLLTLDTVT